MTELSYPVRLHSPTLSVRKNPQWRFHIPVSLDLVGLAPDLHEYAYYLVSLLIRRRIFDARLKYEEYVPLKKEYLQKFVPWKDLQNTLTYLIDDTKQVECDGIYWQEIEGVKMGKCYGYKLSEQLEDSAVSLRIAGDSILRKKLSKEWADIKGRHRPVHKHLIKWLNTVQVDSLAAADAMEELRQQPLKPLRPWYKGERPSWRERRRQQKQHAEAAVLELSSQTERQLIPDDYGRCHSVVTSLPSALRKCLRIEGQHLVGLDICNSQPLILAVLLFQQRRSGLTNLSSLDSGGVGHVLPLRSEIRYKDYWNNDLQELRSACESGRFYESIAGYDLDSKHVRDKFKADFFECVLFGDGKRKSLWTRKFIERYPTAWAAIEEIKAKDFKHLSHNLQKVESTVIFAICDKLRREHPHVPLLTIHDSILTTQDHVETVRTYMMAEFAQYGFAPSLKQEVYE